jgi:hypothetical protein
MTGSAVTSFSDPHEFQASFREADVDLNVIGPGDFQADQINVELPESRMLICREALPAVAHVSLPLNVACIAFLTQDGEPAIADGVRMVMGTVMFWPPGSRFYARTQANTAFACIMFNTMNRAWKNQADEDGPAVLPRACRMTTPPRPSMRRLLRLCLRAKDVAYNAPNLLRDVGAAGELERVLIDAATACLTSDNQLTRKRSWRRHSNIMNRFERVLRENLYRPHRTLELSAAVGVLPRTLRTCCIEFLGMGLCEYLTVRLPNHINRGLGHGDPRH